MQWHRGMGPSVLVFLGTVRWQQGNKDLFNPDAQAGRVDISDVSVQAGVNSAKPPTGDVYSHRDPNQMFS